MLISHETPICLLEESLKFNDYDFILNHLLDKHPKYKEFYLNKSQRTSILDNSSYEYFINGQEFDEKNFIKNIKELQPTYYLIPDVLMDSEKTMELFEKWKYVNKYEFVNCKKIAVVQGKTLKEWLDCYLFYWKNQQHFDKIAISFHYDFLKTFSIPYSESEDVLYALGRFNLLKFLFDNKMIMNKPYHLLGSHIGGIEFHWYKVNEFNFIETIDTGYPVKFGIEEILTSGLNMQGDPESNIKKPNIILDDFIDKELTEIQIETILENIKTFKTQIYG